MSRHHAPTTDATLAALQRPAETPVAAVIGVTGYPRRHFDAPAARPPTDDEDDGMASRLSRPRALLAAGAITFGEAMRWAP